MKTLVLILGETFEVQTERLRGHSGWIARGNYKDHRVEAKGLTKPGAVARWRQQVLDMGMFITRPRATLLRDL